MLEALYITWKNCWWLLTLTVRTQMTPHLKCYHLSKFEIEFNVIKKMYAALRMRTCAENFLGKDDWTIVEWEKELVLEDCIRQKLTQP